MLLINETALCTDFSVFQKRKQVVPKLCPVSQKKSKQSKILKHNQKQMAAICNSLKSFPPLSVFGRCHLHGFFECDCSQLLQPTSNTSLLGFAVCKVANFPSSEKDSCWLKQLTCLNMDPAKKLQPRSHLFQLLGKTFLQPNSIFSFEKIEKSINCHDALSLLSMKHCMTRFGCF